MYGKAEKSIGNDGICTKMLHVFMVFGYTLACLQVKLHLFVFPKIALLCKFHGML